MATNINFYLNETKINPPKNWQELEIELNFDKDNPASKVNINDWEFVRENTDTILKWINDGVTGAGPGVTEGIPFKIEVEKAGIVEKPFNGYLDLTENPNLSSIRSTVTAKERQNIDWLNDVADSFTFEYLYKEKKSFTSDDFVFVPYVLQNPANYYETSLSLLSIFVIAEQIKQSVEKVAGLVAEMANPFEATAIIRAVLYVTYLTALIIAIVKLIKDLVLLIVQPIKYHAGMYVKDLMRIGATHLGLTFKSPGIFDVAPWNKEVIIPEKYYNAPDKNDKRILGFLSPNKLEQNGYFKGTFGELLRAYKTKFNAKIIITENKELLFVREDYNPSAAQYQLPDLYQPYFKTNANELTGNVLISFETDLADKNTINEYTGTAFQVITQQKTVVNQDLVLLKGLREERIPFALAKRKNELSVVESIFKELLDSFSFLINGLVAGVNALISAYNAIVKVINTIIKALKTIGIKLKFQIKTIPKLNTVNLGQLIENRVGMMKLESDIITRPKCLILDAGSLPKYNKINANNHVYNSAKYLYDNSHITSSFVPNSTNPNGNQYIIKELEKVPFTFNDYIEVKKDNKILDFGGNPAKIASLLWNIYNQTAKMTVWFNQLYTNNLTETYLEPTGS